MSKVPAHPEAFPHPWLRSISALEWAALPDRTRAVWTECLASGELNLTTSLLDRHVDAGRGATVAVVAPTAESRDSRNHTYQELLDLTARFASGLSALGVGPGDRVLVLGDSTLEAYVTLLACLRTGATWSFAGADHDPVALAHRLSQITPSVVVLATAAGTAGSANASAVLERAFEVADWRPRALVVAGSPERMGAAAATSWSDLLTAVAEPAAPTSLPGSHPGWVCYSAGTQGDPRGFVRRIAVYAVGLHRTVGDVLRLQRGNVVTSDCLPGSAMGDAALFGSLLAGLTFMPVTGSMASRGAEGAPTAPAATALITRPHAVDELLGATPGAQHATTVFLSGEAARSRVVRRSLETLAGRTVRLYWRAEDGFPLQLGSGQAAESAVPGWRHRPLVSGSTYAELDVVGFPPPDLLAGVDAAGQLRITSEPPARARATGDVVLVDDDGRATVVGRLEDLGREPAVIDQLLQVEDLVEQFPGVCEVAVVHGPPTEPRIRAFVVLDRRTGPDAVALEAIRARVTDQVAHADVVGITRLPRTRSGSILRRTLRDLLVGRDIPVPLSLSEVGVLDDVRAAISARTAGIDVVSPGAEEAAL